MGFSPQGHIVVHHWKDLAHTLWQSAIHLVTKANTLIYLIVLEVAHTKIIFGVLKLRCWWGTFKITNVSLPFKDSNVHLVGNWLMVLSWSCDILLLLSSHFLLFFWSFRLLYIKTPLIITPGNSIIFTSPNLLSPFCL